MNQDAYGYMGLIGLFASMFGFLTGIYYAEGTSEKFLLVSSTILSIVSVASIVMYFISLL